MRLPIKAGADLVLSAGVGLEISPQNIVAKGKLTLSAKVEVVMAKSTQVMVMFILVSLMTLGIFRTDTTDETLAA